MTVLKYSIRKLLLQHDGSFTANKYQLCIELGITEKTLNKWMKINQGDRYSIPSDTMYQLARYFKCNPDDLLTTTPILHG